MEIHNLGRADGSDSNWSLHLILMETEQLWTQIPRIWQAGNILEPFQLSQERMGCWVLVPIGAGWNEIGYYGK